VTELLDEVLKDVSPTTVQFKVLTYLAFRGPSNPVDISEETQISPGSVRPALRTLLDKGYVDQLDDGSYRSLVPFTEIVSHLYSFTE
jgi:DNA-binding MarR family transcriptional regulator